MALSDRFDFGGRWRQTLTSAGYLGLLGVGVQIDHRRGWLFAVGAIALVGFGAWAATYKRARAIADIATSRIGSAAQGYVEVLGRGSVAREELILCPCSATPCLWYRYRIYEKSGSKREWREIDRGESHATFAIADASGSCRVDPEHAEVIPAETRTTYPSDTKQVEEFLFGGSPIYVLGEYTTRIDVPTPLQAREDIGALMATWKEDPVRLRQRFDLDRNGVIDAREWELARRLAASTVDKQHRELRNAAEEHTLRAPADGRLFIISALAPQKLRRRYLLWSLFHLGVAMAAAGVLIGMAR
ncbi:MAG: hypothetical protein ABIO45_03050 [Burkholderiaceae bacterium]